MAQNAVRQSEEPGEGGGRHRSPNFPAISLQDALGKTRILYDKDRRQLVRPQTVLAHLGFSEKLSGSAARVISSMRQFGLIEDVGGQYRVSDAAYKIFALSDAAPERRRALQDCARKPAIYRDLLGKYEDGLPSDAALRDYLILSKRFNEASVATFIRVFKASLDFAKLTPGVYSSDAHDEVSSAGEQVQSQPVTVDQSRPPQMASSNVSAPVGMVSASWPMKNGNAVLTWPASLDADGVSDLEAWLDLVIKKIRREMSAQDVEA